MTGEISALGCAFTWALSSVFTKSLAPRFHPLTLNLLRCLGASSVLWALIPFYPGIQSLYQAPAASVLTSCAPLFGLPLSALYLKERVTPRVQWGTGVVVTAIFFLLVAPL